MSARIVSVADCFSSPSPLKEPQLPVFHPSTERQPSNFTHMVLSSFSPTFLREPFEAAQLEAGEPLYAPWKKELRYRPLDENLQGIVATYGIPVVDGDNGINEQAVHSVPDEKDIPSPQFQRLKAVCKYPLRQLSGL